MDMWDECLLQENAEEKINHLIDSNGYVLFFKKDDSIFGAGEDSRVAFAKMKNPDDDLPKGWEDEASFSADNLNKAIRGEPHQHVFHKNDLEKMSVIDREEVMKTLKKDTEKLGDDAFPARRVQVLDISKLFHHDPDDAPNFVRADEK